MGRNSDHKIDVSDLQYYFDAQEKNTLDGSKYCIKSRAILALRDRLLNLPDADFDSAMKTLNGFIDQQSKSHNSDANTSPQSQEKDAMRLYEQGTAKEAIGTSKVNPI